MYIHLRGDSTEITYEVEALKECTQERALNAQGEHSRKSTQGRALKRGHLRESTKMLNAQNDQFQVQVLYLQELTDLQRRISSLSVSEADQAMKRDRLAFELRYCSEQDDVKAV